MPAPFMTPLSVATGYADGGGIEHRLESPDYEFSCTTSGADDTELQYMADCINAFGDGESLPWNDCKVAFDVSDVERLWDSWDTIPWPAGWELVETDGTGAGFVAIFRVSGIPTAPDGQRVLELIKPYQ